MQPHIFTRLPKSIVEIGKDNQDYYFLTNKNVKSYELPKNYLEELLFIPDDFLPLRAGHNYHPHNNSLFWEIQEFFFQASPIPHRQISMLSTCALFSHLCARWFYVGPYSASSSLYYAILAPSGSGKEQPLMLLHDLLRQLDIEDEMIHGMATAKRSLFEKLAEPPHKILMHFAELGSVLESMSNKTDVRHRLINELILLWTRANRYYQNDFYVKGSGVESSGKIIERPALTILGDTIPEIFLKACRRDLYHNGFLNRFIVLITDIEAPHINNVPQRTIPPHLVNWYRNLKQRHQQQGAPIYLTFDFDALMWIEEKSCHPDNLWRRHLEQVIRFSLAWTLCKNPHAQEVTQTELVEVDQLFSPIRHTFVDHFEKNQLNSPFGELCDKIYKIIQKKARPDGSFLLKHIYQYAHLKSTECEEVLSALITAGKIFTKYHRNTKKYFLADD